MVARQKFLSQYPDHGTEHPYAQRQNTWRSRLRSKLKSYRLIPASFSDGVDTERPRQSASAVSTTIPPITWPSIEFDYPFKLQPHSWYAARLWRIHCSSVRTFHVPFHGKGQATFRVCNPIRAVYFWPANALETQSLSDGLWEGTFDIILNPESVLGIKFFCSTSQGFPA